MGSGNDEENNERGNLSENQSDDPSSTAVSSNTPAPRAPAGKRKRTDSDQPEPRSPPMQKTIVQEIVASIREYLASRKNARKALLDSWAKDGKVRVFRYHICSIPLPSVGLQCVHCS